MKKKKLDSKSDYCIFSCGDIEESIDKSNKKNSREVRKQK